MTCTHALAIVALVLVGVLANVARLRNQGVKLTLPDMPRSTNGRKSGKEYQDTYEEWS